MFTIDRLYRINNNQIRLRTFCCRQDVFDMGGVIQLHMVDTLSFRVEQSRIEKSLVL